MGGQEPHTPRSPEPWPNSTPHGTTSSDDGKTIGELGCRFIPGLRPYPDLPRGTDLLAHAIPLKVPFLFLLYVLDFKLNLRSGYFLSAKVNFLVYLHSTCVHSVRYHICFEARHLHHF